jgi:hypothetical protein
MVFAVFTADWVDEKFQADAALTIRFNFLVTVDHLLEFYMLHNNHKEIFIAIRMVFQLKIKSFNLKS